ncbi:MFS general substrate transporter [Cylindrobasidium torrendii FP15055 ss-10]|uniref:MFS general substrate transporter n=1 Tax=Cylindrobasidium torrendii FP15055 ss-10 TaxID=1314674 RepID=A0A0D7B573_9AGAR|nr:MFS general substrate transporter [Cylindrobasidium torrendii FP15055 ss-10]
MVDSPIELKTPPASIHQYTIASDRGFHAWAYLISAFAIEMLVWSYPFSYGVFLDHYATHEFSHVSSSSLSLVGSLCTGLMYFASLIIMPVIYRYPWYKRHIMWLGVALCTAGLIGAAFATELWHLLLTQGIMYALGGSMLYFPAVTYLWEWFSEKKGLANGLIYSGTGVGGVVMPLVIQALLTKYGSKTTLIALVWNYIFGSCAFTNLSCKGTSFCVIIPTFPFIKPRVPVAHIVQTRPVNTDFLRSSRFWILFMSNAFQGLGNFVPTLYMPTFATALNLHSGGTISLSLMNGASALGLVFLGYLSDRFDIRTTILISAIGSALSVFLLWGFATTLGPLLVFALTYGFLAPSWSALWPRFVGKVAGDDPTESSTMMCIFIAGRGIGNVLSAPIASGLLQPWSGTGKALFAYGVEGYGRLIIFTGIMLVGGSVGALYSTFESPTSSMGRVARRRGSTSIP